MPSGEGLLVDMVCIALHRGEGRLPELQSPCRGLNALRAGSFFLMAGQILAARGAFRLLLTPYPSRPRSDFKQRVIGHK